VVARRLSTGSLRPFGPVDNHTLGGEVSRTSWQPGQGQGAHRLAGLLRAGSVWVNCYQAMDPVVPFGGYKVSGYGREGGIHQFDDYLNVKAVWIKTA
jgi:acyl-CoA reductase-like NAD-dependent aldehyde dehydrogenase